MHLIRQLIARQPKNIQYIVRHVSSTTLRTSAVAEPLAVPTPRSDDTPPNPKLLGIVNQIAQLNLLEVSELSALLKKTLNLPDAPVVSYGAGPAAPAAVKEEEAEPIAVQSSFTVRLIGYSEEKKVQLIKEIKSQTEGINLVQAKKILEGIPANFKSDLSKDDADKLKAKLESAGATCEIK